MVAKARASSARSEVFVFFLESVLGNGFFESRGGFKKGVVLWLRGKNKGLKFTFF